MLHVFAIYSPNYWTSGDTAEVDFILNRDSSVFPLEVKAGTTAQARSLRSYAQKYGAKQLLRTNLLNFKHDAQIYNYPL